MLIIGLSITQNSYGYNDEASSKLFQEVMDNNLEAIKKNLENGANINVKDKNGWTLLHIATNSRNIKMIEFLINNGANINAQDNDGDTPLHTAVIWQNQEIVKLLIQHNANANIQNNNGITPLAFSMNSQNKEIAELLIQRRDIPLSQSRKKTQELGGEKYINSSDFSTFWELDQKLIYNNDAYEQLKTYIPEENETEYKESLLTSGHGFKGKPLTSSREGNYPADFIGYSLWLPKDMAQTEAILICAYGGRTTRDRPDPFNSIALTYPIFKYLLSKNIGIMNLNTVDLKDNEKFQHLMLKDTFMRVLNNVKSAYEVLSSTPEILHENLKSLPKKLPLYFYGASFGGGLGVRFAQTYPHTFKGYISHDGSLAEERYQNHLRPDLHVKKLQDNILILQNYTDNNVLLDSQMKFYDALKKESKTPLVQLHFFPEANLEADEKINIGHFLSNEPWYLQEYTQAILDFIEKTKNGKTIFTSPLPGSVQEMRELFHKTAFQEHAQESSQFERSLSIGFKIYKNALQWRDPELRKNNTFEMNKFMEKWFNAYKKKNNIANAAYASFLQKSLDILSNDEKKADESWNSIYLNIIEEPNSKNLDKKQVQQYRNTLVETLKKSRSLIGNVIRTKIRNIPLKKAQPSQLENLTTLLHVLKTKLMNLLQTIKSLA